MQTGCWCEVGFQTLSFKATMSATSLKARGKYCVCVCVCVCVCAFNVCVYRVVPRACKLTLNLAGQCMLTCTIAMASCVILPRHALFFRRKTSQQYGIQVEAGDSDRYVITSNTLTGNQGVGLDDGGNGENKAVANNIDGLSSQAP